MSCRISSRVFGAELKSRTAVRCVNARAGAGGVLKTSGVEYMGGGVLVVSCMQNFNLRKHIRCDSSSSATLVAGTFSSALGRKEVFGLYARDTRLRPTSQTEILDPRIQDTHVRCRHVCC